MELKDIKKGRYFFNPFNFEVHHIKSVVVLGKGKDSTLATIFCDDLNGYDFSFGVNLPDESIVFTAKSNEKAKEIRDALRTAFWSLRFAKKAITEVGKEKEAVSGVLKLFPKEDREILSTIIKLAK